MSANLLPGFGSPIAPALDSKGNLICTATIGSLNYLVLISPAGEVLQSTSLGNITTGYLPAVFVWKGVYLVAVSFDGQILWQKKLLSLQSGSAELAV